MQELPFDRDTSRKTSATIECPKSMVGRVIGKNGDTIKALQNYTGSLIQVNQVDDPCQISISGTQQSLSLAMSMVADIVRGTFKGFALLRQLAGPQLHQQHQIPRPIYAPGYGLIPSTQVRYREVVRSEVPSAAEPRPTL
jgi:rRNA processing protein Krr1/Pno1